MNFDVKTQDLQIQLRNKRDAAAEAKSIANEAYEALRNHIRELMPQQGMGQDALVRHVHRAANHGNPSDRGVISRVVGAAPATDPTRVVLRIQLGSVKGGLSSAYAFLDVDDVQVVTERSEKPYNF